MITISHLFKSFGAKQVLDDVNISCRPGSVSGIVGKNGAGKTTLFRCIAGIESYEGSIVSSGQELKGNIAFLPTAPVVIKWITGREYLQLMANAGRVYDVDFDQYNVFDLPLGEYMHNYSTGMIKKLSIVGILLQRRDIIILDEPFNGVDIQSNIIITEMVQRWKEAGKTVIIASHIFSTLVDTCDMIHHIEDGQIINSVAKDSFDQVEAEIKQVIIDDRLDNIQW